MRQVRINSDDDEDDDRSFKEAGLPQGKKISNDQELIQSDPISCPQNQKGK